MAVGLGALQIMLEKGDQKDWFASHIIRYLAVAALPGPSPVLVVRELTAETPAVNLRILKDINFSSGSFMGGILGMGLFSSLFILPLFLQQLLGYPAFDSGMALMPRSLAMAWPCRSRGGYTTGRDRKSLMALGLFVNAVSFYHFRAFPST